MAKRQRLYVIGPIGGPYKVGVSNNPDKRRKYLQTGNHEQLVVHFEVECENPTGIETWVHDTFYHDHIGGEWVTTPLDVMMETIRGRDLHITVRDITSTKKRVHRGKKPKPPKRVKKIKPVKPTKPKKPMAPLMFTDMKRHRPRIVEPGNEIRIFIRMPAKLKAEFKSYCAERFVGMSEVIREAIILRLAEYDRQRGQNG